MVFRNLELVRNIIKEATNLDVTYAYDDLVFAEHSIFIIQFDTKVSDELFCYFQKDCTPSVRKSMEENLIRVAKAQKCMITMKGSFILSSGDNAEQVKLEFDNP